MSVCVSSSAKDKIIFQARDCMIIRYDYEDQLISPKEELLFWFKTNENKILSLLLHLSRTLPIPMNEADYRMEISGYFCKNLEYHLSRLIDKASKGFDMLYVSKIHPEPFKISIKIAMEIFQRQYKRSNKLTKPKNIILTNALGRSMNENSKMERNFDILFAIQRAHKKNGHLTRFGIATFDTVNTAIENNNLSKGDQMKVAISNPEWDFLSDSLIDSGSSDERKAIRDLLEEEFRKDKEECYKKYSSIVDMIVYPEKD